MGLHRILIFSATAALAVFNTAILAARDGWSEFTDSFFRIVDAIDWPEFRPDASQSIDLDVAGREHVDHRQPGIASRFANFLSRALTHDDFAAGHFDPGRMPA